MRTATPEKVVKGGHDPRETTLWWYPSYSTGGFNRFWVQVATDQDFASLVIDEDSVLTSFYRIEDLEFGMTYFARVAGVDILGRYTFNRQIITFKTNDRPVSLISPIDGAEDILRPVVFEWNPTPDILDYTFQIADNAAFSNSEIFLVNGLEFEHGGLEPGHTYYWRVRGTGLWSDVWSFKVSTSGPVGTGVESESGIPTEFALHPAYPNPLNPSTTIRFDLPEAANVRLVVFDALGRVVESLVDDWQPSGRHAVRWDAKFVPSGTYFVRFEAGRFNQSLKMVLLK